MSGIEKCLEYYKDNIGEIKHKKFGNYSVEVYKGYAAIRMFNNMICILFPDGGKIFSNCGYLESSTTRRSLNRLGCDWRNSKDIFLPSIFNTLQKL